MQREEGSGAQDFAWAGVPPNPSVVFQGWCGGVQLPGGPQKTASSATVLIPQALAMPMNS